MPTTIDLARRASVSDCMSFADAGLGLAGHELSDPLLRSILEQNLSGELTDEEAAAEARVHLLG